MRYLVLLGDSIFGMHAFVTCQICFCNLRRQTKITLEWLYIHVIHCVISHLPFSFSNRLKYVNYRQLFTNLILGRFLTCLLKLVFFQPKGKGKDPFQMTFHQCGSSCVLAKADCILAVCFRFCFSRLRFTEVAGGQIRN